MATMGSLLALGFLVLMVVGTPVVSESTYIRQTVDEMYRTDPPDTFSWYQYQTFGSNTLSDDLVTVTNSTLGTIEVSDQNMTATAARNSTYYGQSIGTLARHNYADTSIIHFYASIVNKVYYPYNGTFVLAGLVNISSTINEVAIVGGTGDFRKARGYATAVNSKVEGTYLADINHWTAYFDW